MPKNIATKPPRMLSLANCTATTRRGMLERKEVMASKIKKKRNDCFKDQQKRKEAIASKINKKEKS